VKIRREIPVATEPLAVAPFAPSSKDDRMKILMVLTSHETLGSTGRKAGFWLEEFAARTSYSEMPG
jgi:hypothetical protein